MVFWPLRKTAINTSSIVKYNMYVSIYVRILHCTSTEYTYVYSYELNTEHILTVNNSQKPFLKLFTMFSLTVSWHIGSNSAYVTSNIRVFQLYLRCNAPHNKPAAPIYPGARGRNWWTVWTERTGPDISAHATPMHHPAEHSHSDAQLERGYVFPPSLISIYYSQMQAYW